MIRIGKIERVIFDLDGTLFDSQTLHAKVESELMREHGVEIDPAELTAQFAGRPTEWVFKQVLGCDDDLAARLMRQKWEQIIPKAAEIKPLGDIRRIFSRLNGMGISCAIGTASPVRWALSLLNEHRLTDILLDRDIIGGDMVDNGKPSPDIWNLAARGTSHARCLVIEDGTAGIDATVAAGMPSLLLLPRKHEAARSVERLDGIFKFIP